MSIQDTYIDELRVLTLADTIPPIISVSIAPDTLWPPNHKMIPIIPTITVTDNSSCYPSVELTSITMNEGDETNTYDSLYDLNPGDGNTINDIQIIGGEIYLRADPQYDCVISYFLSKIFCWKT